MTKHSNLVFLKYRDCSIRGADIDGLLLVTRAYWALKKAHFEQESRPLFSDSCPDERMDWKDGPTLLGLIEPVEVSATQAALIKQTFKLDFYPLLSAQDEEGAEVWRTFVLAGFGEIGFLDNVGLAVCVPHNEKVHPWI